MACRLNGNLELTLMCRAKLKPLLNLAVAVLISQSAAMPTWGAPLLSCGFTSALRIIKSADAVKRYSIERTICSTAQTAFGSDSAASLIF